MNTVGPHSNELREWKDLYRLDVITKGELRAWLRAAGMDGVVLDDDVAFAAPPRLPPLRSAHVPQPPLGTDAWLPGVADDAVAKLPENNGGAERPSLSYSQVREMLERQGQGDALLLEETQPPQDEEIQWPEPEELAE
jgi:hypothetical protein